MATKFIVYKEDGKRDHFANFKTRMKELGTDAKVAVLNAWNWVKANKEDLVIVGTAAATIYVRIKKVNAATARETNRRVTDYTYYDPSTGARWHLRRPLNNREQMELITRKRNGERAEQILSEMGLLRW